LAEITNEMHSEWVGLSPTSVISNIQVSDFTKLRAALPYWLLVAWHRPAGGLTCSHEQIAARATTHAATDVRCLPNTTGYGAARIPFLDMLEPLQALGERPEARGPVD
jgi:hypothetical protein